MAPNQRDKIKRSITLWLDCDIWVKLNKLAEKTGLDKTALLTAYIEKATRNIQLNENDYREITKWINR